MKLTYNYLYTTNLREEIGKNEDRFLKNILFDPYELKRTLEIDYSKNIAEKFNIPKVKVPVDYINYGRDSDYNYMLAVVAFEKDFCRYTCDSSMVAIYFDDQGDLRLFGLSVYKEDEFANNPMYYFCEFFSGEHSPTFITELPDDTEQTFTNAIGLLIRESVFVDD